MKVHAYLLYQISCYGDIYVTGVYNLNNIRLYTFMFTGLLYVLHPSNNAERYYRLSNSIHKIFDVRDDTRICLILPV